MKRLLQASTGIAVALTLVACGGSSDPAEDETTTPAGETTTDAAPAEPVTITVLAAASLTDVFTELAEAYETEHEGVTVELSFGSSTTLAQQIAEGVDADIFASAGTGALDSLPEDYAANGGEEVIATNVLEIAVQPGNPSGITGLEDFTRSDIDTVLCESEVPCGRAADQAFEAQNITPTPASREIDVRATLAKITLKEADAAIVYQSDVVAEDGVDGVQIPLDQNVVLEYPLVWFNTDEHTVGLAEFIAGPAGEKSLTNLGFSLPTP